MSPVLHVLWIVGDSQSRACKAVPGERTRASQGSPLHILPVARATW